MKTVLMFVVIVGAFVSLKSLAVDSSITDISVLISKEEFLEYKHVGEFIEHSPQVTIVVPTEPEDIAEYGQGVMKSLTGSDCDRDGKMDDNATCNAVYYKLWLKYKR